MKKKYYTFILLCFITLFSSCKNKITEEEYLKVDNKIWENLDNRMNEIYKYQSKYPHKKDSLFNIRSAINKKANIENVNAAIKYSSTKSGLERLFMVRSDISKQRLQKVYNKLSKENKESENGITLSLYLKSKQIKVGDPILNFNSFKSSGEKFQLSELNGKNILLLYGGMKCIGQYGRNELKKFYTDINKNKLEIVVFEPCENLKKLQLLKNKYEADYTFISDFIGNKSPLKIIYNAQALPTAFLINKNGILVVKREGLSNQFLDYAKRLK